MLPVLTVTLNPALDVTTRVAAVEPGRKLRCDAPVMHPGGGGINVTRAIRELGGQSRAFALLGGATGNRIAQMLRHTGIVIDVWTVAEETRTSFTVMDDSSGRPYRFVMPGAAVSPDEVDAILERLRTLIPRQRGFVVASGSLPPGMPMDFYARLAASTRAAGSRLILDTHGEALRQASKEHPFLIRLNHLEAQELVGGDAATAAHTLARELVASGYAETAIVSIGDRGAILSTRDGLVEIHPPPVAMKAGVGAGDSFVAALTYALARDWSISDAARYGVAAAASAVTTEATELCHRPQVDAYYAQIHEQPVPA